MNPWEAALPRLRMALAEQMTARANETDERKKKKLDKKISTLHRAIDTHERTASTIRKVI